MGAESRLIQKLNETVQYTKQKLVQGLHKLQTDKRIDVANNDLGLIVAAVNSTLDQVYRDVAREYSAIKEDIQRETAAHKHGS